jgi:trk system potassium uptake protein
MNREIAYFKQRYATVFYSTGVLFFIVALIILSPLIALPFYFYEQRQAPAFILPAALLALISFALLRVFKSHRSTTLTIQEASIIVFISWTVLCIFSAFPFMLGEKLTFTQGVFEAASGYSTTGLTVVDVTKCSHLIMLWRSIMQFAGGAGLAILMLSAIISVAGANLSIAEGRTDQLVPQIKQSARLVLYIYAGYVAAGVLGYWLLGMSLFDAVNHSIAAVSTGGFSTRVESIGYWDSPPIEGLSIVLMILGNMNFLTSYLLLQGNFKAVLRNGEIRVMAVFIAVAFLVFALSVTPALFPLMSKSLRVAIFETVSALTTSGFSTVGYRNWNSLGFLMLILLMTVGGGTCSTAGGLKQYRIYLLYKTVVWDIRRFFLPRSAIVENYVWQGENKDYIKDDRIRQVTRFVFLYFVVYCLAVGILCAYGNTLQDSMFEIASALANAGLSIGVTSATAPTAVLWTETLCMFLGRLEFFVIFLGIGVLLQDAAVFSRFFVKTLFRKK